MRVVDCFNRKLKSKRCKWLTRNKTHRYVDLLDKFVWGYEVAVHSSTGMAPSLVRDKYVLRIWESITKR
jgi:hypothetical protein